MCYDPDNVLPDLSDLPLPSPYQKPRYVPLGQHQEHRLLDMLYLDNEDKYYVHTNMRDFHLMESLRKRGLVWFTENDWFLSDAGKKMAQKLLADDNGLTF